MPLLFALDGLVCVELFRLSGSFGEKDPLPRSSFVRGCTVRQTSDGSGLSSLMIGMTLTADFQVDLQHKIRCQ